VGRLAPNKNCAKLQMLPLHVVVALVAGVALQLSVVMHVVALHVVVTVVVVQVATAQVALLALGERPSVVLVGARRNLHSVEKPLAESSLALLGQDFAVQHLVAQEVALLVGVWVVGRQSSGSALLAFGE